jgi:hypothetical protein
MGNIWVRGMVCKEVFIALVVESFPLLSLGDDFSMLVQREIRSLRFL